jgi:hypothetical protein
MNGWKLTVPVLGLIGAFASCATGQVTGLTTGTGGHGGGTTSTTSATASSSSSGGTGGKGTGGAGTGGSTSSTTTSSSSSSGADGGTCGDGIKDGSEQCDGTDFGGATCQTEGFGSGTLMCNAFCFIVVSGCTPLPNCLDPTQSCADPNCVGKPGCVDACLPPFSAMVPGFVSGDTTARPTTHQASCSTTPGGYEEIFQVTAPTSGNMSLDLSFFGVNLSLSVRTACAMDSSEIACSNKPNPMMFGDVTLSVPVMAGQTYFVVVQGLTPADQGAFSLNLDIPLPETICNNFIDDDVNGYTDCDDKNCQMTSPDCMPGTQAVGTACTVNTNCAANNQDPVCLDAIDFQQFPLGYCSEFCSATDPCSTGNICYTGLMISTDGVCLHTCTVDTDCRTADGYACVDKGLASKVCWLGPETICNDYIDNDFNKLTDCDDPNCQATSPACVPGSNAIGQPCTMHNQCSSSVGTNNPFCFDQAHEGYTNGYCSHFCDPAKVGDCGPNGICVNNGPNAENVCMQTCSTNAQCRTADGYSCLNLGYPKMVCSF